MKETRIKLSKVAMQTINSYVMQQQALQQKIVDTMVIFASSSDDFNDNSKVSLSEDLTEVIIHNVDEDKKHTEKAS